jgi:hypothetical protein
MFFRLSQLLQIISQGDVARFLKQQISYFNISLKGRKYGAEPPVEEYERHMNL